MREKLRLFILDRYEVDIDSKKFTYNNNSYYYILNNGEITLKIIGLGGNFFSREEKLSQMLWADDLALFKGTVCKPLTSKKGNLIETTNLGNWNISITAYETPKGHLPEIAKIRPLFFVVLGDLIGGIHNTSMEQNNFGMHYKLPSVTDMLENRFDEHRDQIPKHVQNSIMDIISDVKLYKQTPENYGMCYGSFDMSSILLDVNNPYIFDFDNCSYGFYLYDIATFVWDLITKGYLPNIDSKKMVFNNVLTWFSVGYRINKQSDESFFKDIELFLKLHTVKKYIDFKMLNVDGLDSITTHIEMSEKLVSLICADDFFNAADKIIR